VGERVRQFRLHSRGGKLTQETLAEKADISVSFLSMIERGERSAHMDTLASLADALEISMEDLFRDRSKPTEAIDPVLRPLADFAERRKLSRRDIDRLLVVAKALFEG
jgi:transcriptional regulator with XRE-family HTH domain